MSDLKPMYKTWATGAAWIAHLASDEVAEILEHREKEVFTAHEMLEEIISWRGGLGSAIEMEQLLNDIYDIDLDNHDDLSWTREEGVD